MISKYKPSIIIAVFLLTFTSTTTGVAQNRPARSGPVRERFLLDLGWKFHFGDASTPEGDFGYGLDASFAKAGETVSAAQPGFNDSSWKSVDLPHDWALELEFVNVKNEAVRSHGYKPVGRQFPKTSIGWYRRTFTMPASDRGMKQVIQFDGVFRDCTVWLNGHYIGRNLGGYNEFSFEISDYLSFGKKNVLVVRADASQYEGWFYEGAGIYRHVWLLTYPPLHITSHGTFVTTETGPNSAAAEIETKVLNQEDRAAECKLVSTIINAQGKEAGTATLDIAHLSPSAQRTLRQKISVQNPQLWSPDSPYLYRLVSALMAGKDTIDRMETQFGIRTVRFDKDSGFVLNGKRLEIKGVCCHQDHAGVGSALPDRLQYYRIEKLKEMGANAYRTSHNPPTPELLDACDRLGMLVMDENRLMGSSPDMLRQMEQLILRDRNHPSVIIWSLGNEEWQIQNDERGANIARSLKRLQQQLDPSRLCTYAGNNGDHYDGINSVVDVRGVNYMNIGDIDKYHRAHPAQPVWGSEEASTFCTRGVYATDTVAGYVTDYDVNKPGYGALAEEWWKYYAKRPWLAGAFVWTGFDYRGEPSPYDWPCISSHFGIMDVCGFPKNNYYYYQAWWTDTTVLHIAPHWNWPGKNGQPIDVWCQTNCDSVELSLNGKSLGVKVVEPNSHLQWKVLYEPGMLEAKGWKRGKTITTRVETTDQPVTIRLTPDRTTIHADGEDLCVVNVSVLDAKGRVVDTADNLIRFDISGYARFIGVGNGDPSSHEPDRCPDGHYQRKLFNGRCQVIVQSTRAPGSYIIKAFSEGLQSTDVTVQGEKSQPRPVLF